MLSVFFALFESALVKAALKMLVKLTLAGADSQLKFNLQHVPQKEE